MGKKRYRALVSSDWNECLAPCGPFDYIAFIYPDLSDSLESLFRRYTQHRMSLGQAIQAVTEMIPGSVTQEQMDAYIDARFTIYPGVTDLMEWCLSKDILWMINTTGAIGYFQRIIAKKRIPPLPLLSAHPCRVYSRGKSDPNHIMPLLEVSDKGRNTQRALHAMDIASSRPVLIGDSGGDGPHFKWGQANNAFLIGSMTKPSLQAYCRQNGIRPDLLFGISYGDGDEKNHEQEMGVNFRDLIPVIADMAGVSLT